MRSNWLATGRADNAAERCVEIISEASKRIPQEWKAEHPEVPWQDIAGIGSVLRTTMRK
jgi:uncharacterized protein with HEPN domain